MDPVGLSERYGPWALVTGGAVGFGAAYADSLAAAGLSVLLADVDAGGVRARAADLADRHGVEVEPVVADLGDQTDVDSLLERAGAVDLGLLVANAAASFVGPFVERSLESLLLEVDVNVVSSLRLVHGLVPAMRTRSRAGIVLMSSQSSRRGAPLVANYAGTKAYLAVLAESLWDELGPQGVDVLAVLPGSTRTPGWLSSEPRVGAGTANVMEPEEVVPEVLATIGRQPSLVPGRANREAEELMGGLDRAEAVRMVGQVMREMYLK